MTTCPSCLGLIMEPGKAYGYAGKVCQCQRETYTQPKHSFQELCDMFTVTPDERVKLVEHLKLIRNLKLDELKEPK